MQVEAPALHGRGGQFGLDAPAELGVGRVDVERRGPALADPAAGDRRQAGVQHHPQWRLEGRVVPEPHGELWIVRQHRAGTGQDRPGTRPPVLHVQPRGLAADPLGLAAGECAAPVDAGRQLHPQPGAAAHQPREVAAVEFARLRLHQAAGDLDAGRGQPFEAGTVDLRERVAHRRHHPRHAGSHQCLRARRGVAGVGAGLQGDVGGGTPGAVAGCLQRQCLGVRLAGTLVPALAHHLLAVCQHAADHRIGPGGEGTAPGQPQRARHQQVVGRGEPLCRGLAR